MGGTGDRRLERQGSIMDRVNEQLPVSFEDFNERTTDAEADEVAHEVAAQQGEAPQGGAAPAAVVGTSPEAVPIVKKILHSKLTPQQTQLRDKVGFVAGITNIALTAWWMGQWPDTFFWWYTAKSAMLYGLRFLIYKSKNQHYFLTELCYFANLVLLAYLWLPQHSPWLYKATFGLIAGPLTWSIVALRNSLVLHSLDQMTSLFMHASPALVVWALRWHASPRVVDFAALPPAQAAAFQHTTFGQLVGPSLALYSVWAVLYYLKVFVVSAKVIKEKNYETLFSLMTKNKNGAVAKIVFSVPKPFQPLIYMIFHFLLSAAAISTSYLCWHSFHYHTAFVLAMLLGAAWNGATFYFSHFAFKYVSKTGLEQPKKKAS